MNAAADKDGWSDRKSYTYQILPNEKRDVVVYTQRANTIWTVVVYDMGQDVGEKRAAQVHLTLGDLLPRGYTRESFADRKASRLDQARVAELGRFVTTARKEGGVPGVAVGLIQDGKVVIAGPTWPAGRPGPPGAPCATCCPTSGWSSPAAP